MRIIYYAGSNRADARRQIQESKANSEKAEWERFISPRTSARNVLSLSKLLRPQFMERAEFVERFRREARAAGRLRHPNVVDVTDFGFSETNDGECCLSRDGISRRLHARRDFGRRKKICRLSWTIDILEQVCSAVHEAHEQGIIHRDLKPDNIWLEPNQRGGYTVKVLDFGIAKLEETSSILRMKIEMTEISDAEVKSFPARETIAGENQTKNIRRQKKFNCFFRIENTGCNQRHKQI